MNIHYNASCLCGSVTLEASGFSKQAAHCHCNMCKKFHGAAFGTLVALKHLRWISGLSLLKEFTASNGTIRTFCSQCGSSIGFRTKNTSLNQIEIAISLFDEPIPVEIDAHIYTNYSANWLPITDSLQIYKEGRDSE